MTKKAKHYLKPSAGKNGTEKETETTPLDDFLLSEYQKATWDSEEMGTKEFVSKTIYGNILGRISPKKPSFSYYKYAAAASIALLIGLGLFLKPETAQAKMLSLKTTTAIDSVKLQDGSTVYLAANSEFTYPEQFSGKERNVNLIKGNAFFSVAKDAIHPFIIKSDDITTKVLGTSFYISLCKNKSRVTVVTGKVNVSAGGQSIDIIPQQEVLYANNTLKKQKATQTSGWYKQDIDLNNATVKELFDNLHYKYGVKFTPVNSRLLNNRITIYIGKNASLTRTLEQITYITNLKFKANEDIITVSQ